MYSTSFIKILIFSSSFGEARNMVRTKLGRGEREMDMILAQLAE